MSMNRRVHVSVPASTANLGPGFDCLGLALDLWNEADFKLEGSGIHLTVEGRHPEGQPSGTKNLVVRYALQLFKTIGQPPPQGMTIHCINRIPIGSGMGSSAAAILTGLLGANGLLGNPVSREGLMDLAADAEGHPDNVSAALLGGLTISTQLARGLATRRLSIAPLQIALAIPTLKMPTRAARAVLPAVISRRDAVFNLGRTALVVEALRNGDLHLLSQVMEDRLHEPYRLPLMPGAHQARLAALEVGAAAVALSGAGPGIAAFGREEMPRVARAMVAAFEAAGQTAEAFVLDVSERGAEVLVEA